MGPNTSWAFAGNAVYAACQWLVFVLLVKALRPADAGHFAYAIALTGPIFVLANMRLRTLLATAVSAPRDFPDYLAARLVTTSIALCASLLVGTMVSGGVEPLVVLTLIACARACDAISDVCHGLFQRELDMRSAAIGLMTNGVVSVVLVAMSLALWPSLTSATGTYAAGSLVALLAWDLPRVRGLADTRCFAGGVARTLRAVRSLTRRAMPLGLSAAIGSVQVNVPRYVIAAYLGPAALAVFTALSHIPTLGNLIVNAIAQAALPVLARDVRQSQAQYRRRLRALVIFGTALGLASVLCTAWIGRPLLAWIYRADYAAHSGVLLWLMAASAVSYAFVFLGTATLARMRFGAQCLISSAGLVVVSGSVVPLVSRYGLAGGACALLAGAIVEGCAYTILTVYDLAGDDQSRGVLSGVLAEGVRS